MSSVGVDENLFEDYEGLDGEDFDWSQLWEIKQWEYFIKLIIEKKETFGLFMGASLLCSLIYFLIYLYGRSWWSAMKRSRLNLSDFYINLLWNIAYIPLGVSAWLIFLENNEKWCRPLTIYFLHLLINIIFPFSIWVIRDFSLALLNLLILIGVAMFTSTQFNNIYPIASTINTPYLLFLFSYFVQFCIIWYLNEGKNMMKEAMKEGIMSSALSSPMIKPKKKTEKTKKGARFPGSRKKLENLKKLKEEVKKLNPIEKKEKKEKKKDKKRKKK